MPLEVPKIDDRTYQEILNEALARIRVHNPEWTNFNESDPGVTLLELFAFMTDSLLYRANRIPERNRRKFIKLLGIGMQPAASAQGLVSFANERNPAEVVTLSPELELKAGNVSFSTLTGLDVLPLEAKAYYKQEVPESQLTETKQLYDRLYRSFQAEGAELRVYQTTLLEPPLDPANIPSVDLSGTLDGSLWVALLARPKDTNLDAVRAKIGGKTLNLGLLPSLQTSLQTLLPERQSNTRAESSHLVFEIATNETESDGTPKYAPLQAQTEVDVLARPGLVTITLPAAAQLGLWTLSEPLLAGTGDFPPSLEETSEEARVITWIRIRLKEKERAAGMRARIAWVGINAAEVVQRSYVPLEIPGQGTGEPDQTLVLVNKPVLPGSVKLKVNGELWQEVEDLLTAPAEVPTRSKRLPPGTSLFPPEPVAGAGAEESSAKVFTIDRESGEIRFGDGLRGARPPLGHIIQVSYHYGGGRQGNVGIGALNKGPLLPAGLKVSNPVPTWGGDEPETVDEAERNIPAVLRHRDRLVTAEDFADIVRRTPGVDIGRVEVLPLFHPKDGEGNPGMVTVMVIPRYDVVFKEAPRPDRLFLELICQHISPRRLLTTEVHVVGPKYQPVYVSAGIELVPGRDFPPVREAVNAAIRNYLSPLTGGREGKGWPLSKAVVQKELWAEVARVDGVLYVNELLLGGASGESVDMVDLKGLQLPWLAGVEAQTGTAVTLAQVQGKATVTGQGSSPGKKIVPVPAVPSCSC